MKTELPLRRLEISHHTSHPSRDASLESEQFKETDAKQEGSQAAGVNTGREHNREALGLGLWGSLWGSMG